MTVFECIAPIFRRLLKIVHYNSNHMHYVRVHYITMIAYTTNAWEAVPCRLLTSRQPSCSVRTLYSRHSSAAPTADPPCPGYSPRRRVTSRWWRRWASDASAESPCLAVGGLGGRGLNQDDAHRLYIHVDKIDYLRVLLNNYTTDCTRMYLHQRVTDLGSWQPATFRFRPLTSRVLVASCQRCWLARRDAAHLQENAEVEGGGGLGIHSHQFHYHTIYIQISVGHVLD